MLDGFVKGWGTSDFERLANEPAISLRLTKDDDNKTPSPGPSPARGEGAMLLPPHQGEITIEVSRFTSTPLTGVGQGEGAMFIPSPSRGGLGWGWGLFRGCYA